MVSEIGYKKLNNLMINKMEEMNPLNNEGEPLIKCTNIHTPRAHARGRGQLKQIKL